MSHVIAMWDDAESLMQAAHRFALQDRPDFGKAYLLLRRAVDLGSPMAAYALGSWYLNGRHVEKDPQRAVGYLEMAARGDIADAYYDLAVCLETGLGTRRNLRRAARHYLDAALLGDAQSAYEIGRCFFFGIGVAKDEEIGMTWIEFARSKGIEE